MIGSIQPLTEVKGDGGDGFRKVYKVVCREHGDVTSEESGFQVERATIEQAGLYRQRHLARHLTALANEVAEAAR